MVLRCARDTIQSMLHAMPAKPHVFTIPASAPFLPTLIDALIVKEVPGFPFRRRSAGARRRHALSADAARLPRWRARSFSTRVKGDAAILPRIVPIGDIDEDEIAFAEAAAGDSREAALDLPPALGGLERAMPLAH